MRAPVEADHPPPANQIEGAPHPREAQAVFGQARAERSFLNAWSSGRLHHGWLLCGPRGVGKATAAYRMAKALLIHGDRAPATLEAPADHPVARRVAAGSEPRLKTVARAWDKEKKRHRTGITVDVVRELNGFFHLSAADGGWRVAIVDPADDLNTSAENALLKMLEEPPPRAVLLLVAHAPGRLLPTIRSRCRTLEFGPLDAGDVARALTAAGAEVGDAGTLAILSAGSPGEAILLDRNDGAALYARLARLLGGAPGMDRRLLIEIADACAGRGAAGRFEMTLALTETLLQRLARAGTGLATVEATAGESRLAARLCPSVAAARIWAEAAAMAGERGRTARAVNLDPAGAILDIWLRIDEVAARVAER
jgi:DNA polymerase-3 subunit delta'